ncbi:MAG: membrane protein [Candidatus Hydrogenedentota bacterium]
MSRNGFLAVSGVLGALAVGLGAFGAHGLKDRLSTEMLAVWHTAVQYHFYHAIAMLAVAAGVAGLWKQPLTGWACWAWTLGIVVFSGSLYALALTGIKILGAITPFGGVAFIAGWVLIAIAGWKASLE